MSNANQMKENIKYAIERAFGEINDRGCYSGETGKWLSTESIFELVCNTIDENDYLFDED